MLININEDNKLKAIDQGAPCFTPITSFLRTHWAALSQYGISIFCYPDGDSNTNNIFVIELTIGQQNDTKLNFVFWCLENRFTVMLDHREIADDCIHHPETADGRTKFISTLMRHPIEVISKMSGTKIIQRDYLYCIPGETGTPVCVKERSVFSLNLAFWKKLDIQKTTFPALITDNSQGI